jgi:hypothetical protein
MAITSPYVDPAHQDVALNSLKARITHMWLCPSIPANYATGNTTKVVEVAVDQSDMTILAGDIDGRKLRFAGATGIANSQTSVTCAVFINQTDQTIEFVNNITTTQVADQGQVTVNAFDIWEVGNPR